AATRLNATTACFRVSGPLASSACRRMSRHWASVAAVIRPTQTTDTMRVQIATLRTIFRRHAIIACAPYTDGVIGVAPHGLQVWSAYSYNHPSAIRSPTACTEY